jgi:hypothetical protein
VTENLFDGRFRYVDELVKMGARITTQGHHALVRGVNHFVGADVVASDIRAGAALTLAGLAEGRRASPAWRTSIAATTTSTSGYVPSERAWSVERDFARSRRTAQPGPKWFSRRTRAPRHVR